HGGAAGEVLGPVDLTEVAGPPAFGTLAIDLVEAVGCDRDALDGLTGCVLVLLLVRLAVAGRRVEDPLRASVDDEEQQLLRLVDLDESAGVGARLGPFGEHRHPSRRL